MTFNELKKAHSGKRLVAMANEENGLSLYAGTKGLEWPSDWPTEGITAQWIEAQGVELLVAA